MCIVQKWPFLAKKEWAGQEEQVMKLKHIIFIYIENQINTYICTTGPWPICFKMWFSSSPIKKMINIEAIRWMWLPFAIVTVKSCCVSNISLNSSSEYCRLLSSRIKMGRFWRLKSFQIRGMRPTSLYFVCAIESWISVKKIIGRIKNT